MAMNDSVTQRLWYEPGGPADSISSRMLRERWHDNERLSASIRNAILKGESLPADCPTVTVTIGRKEVSLIDLRGFAFRGMSFEEVDLSYCCFDFSDFEACAFTHTSLQFSTFRYSSLDGTRWKNVQASPVSFRGATMRGAVIWNCFMMNSDLNSVDLSQTRVLGARLANSDLRRAIFEEARFTDVDLRYSLMSDTHPVRRWYADQKQREGQGPQWFASDVDSRHEGDDAVVMVVDDSVVIRQVLTHELRDNGYRVVLATDGREAMIELGKDPPDLVLLDIQMPGMDGFEVMQRLREEVSTSALPVVMITSKTENTYHRRAVEGGATDFFTKPLTTDDLMTRIGEVLATKRRVHLAKW
jgi:CheY-like chemotaxis protein